MYRISARDGAIPDILKYLVVKVILVDFPAILDNITSAQIGGEVGVERRATDRVLQWTWVVNEATRPQQNLPEDANGLKYH